MIPAQKSNHPDIDFMSLVSHQLSTPLAAVRWYAEILRKGEMAQPLDATQAEFVNEILGGAARMGELVDDMLNASRLERDKFTDDPIPTAMAKIVEQQIEQLEAESSLKKIKVSLDLEPDLPDITARPSVLRMIVQNLLFNAIKYSEDGGSVSMKLRMAGDTEAAKLTHRPPEKAIFFSVSDTGLGIPQSQQDNVFTKFFRADNVRAKGISGTGLGLYIVATAVAKQAGAVWFESTEHQGSNFFVVLPVKNHSDKQEPVLK